MTAPTAAAILEQLEQKDAQVLNLLALCRAEPYLGVWQEGPELLRRFARLLFKQGHPTLALEVAARGLDKVYPGDHDLLYCRALALVNSGNTTRAAVQDLLGHDAIIGRTNYFGSHVSRAARIEPVTAPGCAFVSEQFAAALAVTPGHDFVCEYLGLQPLAKDYDTCPCTGWRAAPAAACRAEPRRR